MTNRLIIIVAGNYSQARTWMRLHGLNPRECVIADDESKIMGMRDQLYVTVGTYYERDDFKKIMDRIRAYNLAQYFPAQPGQSDEL
jgi:hypothetical protein